MAGLLSVFIAATIFGVGVTVLDLFGALGGREGGEEIGDDGADGDDGGGTEIEAGGDDADAGGDDADGEAPEVEGEIEDTEGEGESEPAVLGHDVRRRRNPILAILSAMRNVVYFSLGFGPVGWFAVATGETAVASLLWSAPVGVVVLVGARLIRRLLRSELSSDVKESDLLLERGKVTVGIRPGALGKVRVELAGTYVDRYAKSTEGTPALRPGEPIRVVDLDDGFIIVEPEDRRPELPAGSDE